MSRTTARCAATGAVGVLAMDVATSCMYRWEGAQEVQREEAARPRGKDTAHALVRRMRKAMGSEAGLTNPLDWESQVPSGTTLSRRTCGPVGHAVLGVATEATRSNRGLRARGAALTQKHLRLWR